MNTKTSLHLSRRQIIRGVLSTTAFAVSSRLWTGCTPTKESQASSGAAAKPITMGFIYVGPKDDYGYNQAHHEGEQGVAKLPWVKSLEEANVPETTAVEEAMREMIEQDKATVLFPTSLALVL